MSLILEALRKSEAERRRGQAPDVLADMPRAQPVARRPIAPWLWLLPVLALALVGLWLANRSETPQIPVSPSDDRTTTVTQPSPAAELPPVPRLTPPQTATPPAVVSADRAPTTTAPLPAVASPERPAQPAASAAIQPPPQVAPAPVASPVRPAPVEPLVAQPPTPIPPAPVTRPDAGVEFLSDLSVADRNALPPLKLSMHLWNADPAQRFVILDGNRVVEGDRVGDTVVTEITSDSVVLDWRGRKLTLPIR